MTIYLGLVLAFLIGLTAVTVAAIKNARYWRRRQRDLALSSVKRFAADLDTDNSFVRSELCTRMLSLLRADVAYCLARLVSIRTLGLGVLFFVLYGSYRVRIYLGRPPRKIDALFTTVRRLSESAR